MAIEIVDLPSVKWWFSIVMLVYQRVVSFPIENGDFPVRYVSCYWSHGPVEIVDFPMKNAWWFSSSAFLGFNMFSSLWVLPFP